MAYPDIQNGRLVINTLTQEQYDANYAVISSQLSNELFLTPEPEEFEVNVSSVNLPIIFTNSSHIDWLLSVEETYATEPNADEITFLCSFCVQHTGQLYINAVGSKKLSTTDSLNLYKGKAEDDSKPWTKEKIGSVYSNENLLMHFDPEYSTGSGSYINILSGTWVTLIVSHSSNQVKPYIYASLVYDNTPIVVNPAESIKPHEIWTFTLDDGSVVQKDVILNS